LAAHLPGLEILAKPLTSPTKCLTFAKTLLMNRARSLNHEFDVIGTVFTFDILTVPGICFDKILGPTLKHLEDSGV
jgi:hypothetical protein